jgi:Profilin
MSWQSYVDDHLLAAGFMVSFPFFGSSDASSQPADRSIGVTLFANCASPIFRELFRPITRRSCQCTAARVSPYRIEMDRVLFRSGQYAAIVDHDGSPWASSPGFVVLEEEAKSLSKLLTGTSLDAIGGTGFSVAGQKYAFTRGEVDDQDGAASYLQGRCKEDGKSSQGVIVMCTTKALIVGVHDPAYSAGATFGKVNTDIGRVADYMMEVRISLARSIVSRLAVQTLTLRFILFLLAIDFPECSLVSRLKSSLSHVTKTVFEL